MNQWIIQVVYDDSDYNIVLKKLTIFLNVKFTQIILNINIHWHWKHINGTVFREARKDLKESHRGGQSDRFSGKNCIKLSWSHWTYCFTVKGGQRGHVIV